MLRATLHRQRPCIIAAFVLGGLGLGQAGCKGEKPLGGPTVIEASGSAASQSAGDTQAPSAPEAEPAGWPAGDDPAAAVEALRQHIEDLFGQYRVVEKLIYPEGWTQRRYRPEQVTAELRAGQETDEPRRAVVRVTYQKLSSVIHPDQQSAADDDDLIPYPAEETKEAMTGGVIDRRWPPVEAQIYYELRDDRWVRVDYQTTAVGREGPDWLTRVGVP